ncbi:hypothetical protein E4U32_006835, partial [Claviceps aff. humidiphila group G2b]
PDVEPVDGEIRHQVERVVTSRIRHGQLQYRVDWEGADEDLEWYNAAKLKRWTPKLKIFHDAIRTQWAPHVILTNGCDTAKRRRDHHQTHLGTTRRSRA